MTTEEKIADLEAKVDDMSHALAQAFDLLTAQAEHINDLYQHTTRNTDGLTDIMKRHYDLIEKLYP